MRSGSLGVCILEFILLLSSVGYVGYVGCTNTQKLSEITFVSPFIKRHSPDLWYLCLKLKIDLVFQKDQVRRIISAMENATRLKTAYDNSRTSNFDTTLRGHASSQAIWPPISWVISLSRTCHDRFQNLDYALLPSEPWLIPSLMACRINSLACSTPSAVPETSIASSFAWSRGTLILQPVCFLMLLTLLPPWPITNR